MKEARTGKIKFKFKTKPKLNPKQNPKTVVITQSCQIFLNKPRNT